MEEKKMWTEEAEVHKVSQLQGKDSLSAPSTPAASQNYSVLKAPMMVGPHSQAYLFMSDGEDGHMRRHPRAAYAHPLTIHANENATGTE